MKTSNKGIEFLKREEGVSLVAYPDGNGYSIGYGSQLMPNGTKVQSTSKITLQESENLLNTRLSNEFEKSVNKIKGLNQNQFDALVSLCYNIGVPRFESSGLFNKLTLSTQYNVDSEFRKWVIYKGKTYSPLQKRREREIILYNTPVSLLDTAKKKSSGNFISPFNLNIHNL